MNEARLPRIVSQNLAQLQHIRPQHLRLHIGLRPHRVQQFIVADQPPRMLHKVTQHRKLLGRQCNLRAFVPQALIRCVQPERTEMLHTAAPRRQVSLHFISCTYSSNITRPAV